MKKVLAIVAIAISMFGAVAVSAPNVYAATDACDQIEDATARANCKTKCIDGKDAPQSSAAKAACAGQCVVSPDSCKADANKIEDIIGNIVNTVLYVVGIISVAFIIYGGVKYGTSAGDAGKVKSAKDTLMYAIIGLIIAILAYAIVNFVLGIF